ncbi:hypothetical protein GOODEAATRI_012850, partial [Goodea atripinnis]
IHKICEVHEKFSKDTPTSLGKNQGHSQICYQLCVIVRASQWEQRKAISNYGCCDKENLWTHHKGRAFQRRSVVCNQDFTVSALGKMADRSHTPEIQSRPYDFSRARACSTHVLGQEGMGNASSFQLPHGVLPDPSLLYSKHTYGGITPATTQSFLPFPPVASDYRGSDLQVGDFGQPKHWFPFAAPEYTGQVPGVTAATQPTNLSPQIAETREQIRLPEIKTEEDNGEGYATEMKVQQYPTPAPSTGMTHGVFYSPAWNPSFWPGITHITTPGSNNQNPSASSASSPSMSPSPPSNGIQGNTFFSVNSNQVSSEPQAQNPASNTRSSGSSSGGCSDSEEMYKIERVFVDTRKRKRRTSLEGAVRSALEAYFIKCPKPNTQEITQISDDLGLERDVVRVWFCNRRQKGKRLALPLDEECEGHYYEQSPSPLSMAPSPIQSQAYPSSSYTGAPPPSLYMPQLHRPDVLKQALHPGLVGHLTG